ncbi:MAG: hypothetical protein J6X45_05245 [Lachnospiraceae bacterium]|nr:hypothetical protein [Lachnospiraceae bacterium]
MKKRISRQQNKGAAMIMTVIIIAIIMVFCFSLILVSYNLYASQNKNLATMRNTEASESLVHALDAELTDNENIGKSPLWKYIRMNVAYKTDFTSDPDWNDWPYYDPSASSGPHSEASAVREFALTGNPDMQGVPADVRVYMYWMIPGSVDDFKTKVEGGGYPNGVRLHVKVVSKTANQTYEAEEVYKLTVRKNDNEGKAILSAIDSSCNPGGHTIDSNEKWIWKRVKK